MLLPDLGGNLSDGEKELDAFVDNIDIIDAYIRWCGKMTPNVGGKRESIMISCPDPAHPDKKPSAWINLDKQTYYCGGCDRGGDIHDIAALNWGYPVPGYQQGETFHKLRRDMAESFGFRIKDVPGGVVTWTEDPAPVAPNVEPEPEAEVDKEDSNVKQMWADEEDEEQDLVVYPTIDWKNLIPENTFLHEYLSATCNDDSPEEYHFWHGMLALGLVCGRKVTLDDTRPVYANLLLCILGATGTGKSRSRGYLDDMLREVAPYREDGTSTTGVKIVPIPGSGEYLVSQFAYEGRDPSNNKISLGMQPVTGVVDFDEMSALLARTNRIGSTLGSTIMSMADARNEVSVGGLTRGDFIAAEPFCTITASTQPKSIRNLVTSGDAASGFLNRWVFAGGKQKQIESIGGTRTGIRVDLTQATEELKKVRGWGALPRVIELDDEAYDAYDSYFHAILEPTKSKDDTDLLKRIDLLSKKLMLLLTINQRQMKVTKSTVEVMIKLVDYAIECYGILSGNIGVTVMQEIVGEIERHIKRHVAKTGRGASAADLVRYTKRRNYGLEQIKKALDVMTALDIIELEPKPPGPGRPTARYRTATA